MAQKFLTDIEVTQGLIDSSGDLGVAGQVLSSTGTETNWITNEANSTVVYLDEFTGDNSTVDFTISVSVTDENITQVYIDGVYQNKDTYSVSNTTLTFSTAPPLNADIEVITFSTATTSDDLAAGSVIIPVKNTHTASIAKGEPVYITGNVGSSARLEIAPADASNSAKMPAAGLLLQTLAVNAEGYVITGGYLRNITTDTIDGTSTTSNDTVYVKSGGGLTMTKPTGTNLIQNIAKVARSSGGSSGSLLVSSILRTNDVPNITNDYFWLGNSSGVATPTEFTSTARGLLSVGTEGTAAGDGNLAYNNSSGIFTYTPPVLGGLSGTTDNITEGSTNLYYTDARSRSAISVSGNAISYNSSTGVITSNYEENPTFTGNVTISGNLTVDGTQTILNTQTVEVEDNILQLNTTQGSPDTATATTSGISVYRGDGVTQASFIFDDADDTWDLTNNLVVDGNATINGFFTSQGIDDNANATAITINGSEEVGIGTLTPFYKLDVNGTFRASGNATFAGKILNTYTGTGFHELQNATSNGTVLRLSSTGDSRTLTLQTDHIYSNGNLYFGDNSYATYFRGSSYDFSTGNAHFSGNVTVGNDGDISMDSSANGQLMIDGNGYQGAIALDDTAMYVYHNSSGRNLVLGTNETARLTITASGNATFTGTLTASGYNDSNWNTAYGWGDHAGAGYITSFDITTQTDPKYLRSNAADTLSAAITLDNNGYFVGSPSHGLRFNNSADTINALVVDNSGNSIAYASHRAPIFYDSDDTNYYVNPDSASRINNINVDSGAAYPLQTSSSQRYMVQVRNTGNSTNANYGWWWFMDTNFDMGFHADGASDRFTLTRQGEATVFASMSAPIYYDRNNTNFYVNPATTSNLSTLSTDTNEGIFNNQRRNHSTTVNFNDTSLRAGVNYLQQGSNGPTGTTSHQWYGWRLGLGGDYGTQTGSSGHYAQEWYVARKGQGGNNTGGNFLWTRDMESGSWGSWAKIDTDRLQLASGYSVVMGSWGLRNVTPSGYIEMGPANTGHAHIYTDRSNFYFNKQIQLLGGTLINQNDIRAGVFYDLNDTNYYINPNSTSYVKYLGRTEHQSGHFVGSYNNIGGNSAKSNPIYTIGSSYNPNETTLASMYGIGYAHPNLWGSGKTSDWGLYVANNGGIDATIGDGAVTAWFASQVHAAGDFRAPIFYDLNNTGYYVNPASSSRMQQIDISSAGASGLLITHSDIRSSATSNWTGNPGGAGKIQYHSNRWYIVSDSSSNRIVQFRRDGSDKCYIDNDGRLIDVYDVRAFLYYDRDNTGYYVDPAGTSKFNDIWSTDGGNNGTAPRWDTSFYVAQSQHYYGHSSTQTMYLGESNYINIRNTADIHGDARAPIYYDRNDTGYYVDAASTSNLNAVTPNYINYKNSNFRVGNSTTMNAITSGSQNVAFGPEALGACSTGSRNFAYGYASLFSLTSGSNNIAMGDATGYNVTSGSNNLLFGHNAGRTGYQTPQSIAGVTTGSNQIHMGNESHSTARIQISWTVNSDARDKTDVTPINVGLDFVNQLNPVTFRWDKRSDYEDRTPTGENKLEELTLGFLAQEVETVEKAYGYDVATKTNLVVDRDVENDGYGLTYEKMIPILTKAIQELKADNDSLRARIQTLEDN
jgi:hypothetical protein